MASNKIKQTSSILAEVVIVILVIAVINYLGYKIYNRIDTTENKQYTVHEELKNILAGLPDAVNVDYYLSKDMPSEVVAGVTDLRDLLGEIESAGKGNFILRVIRVAGDDEAAKQEAQEAMIQEYPVQVRGKGTTTTQMMYSGIVIKYQDKTEVMPIILGAGQVQYEFASRILKMTMEEKPKIALFTGFMQTSQEQRPPGYEALKQIISSIDQLYELVMLDPAVDTRLPVNEAGETDLQAVIILGAFNMPDSLKYSIDQYLMGGGQVLVAVDPIMDTGGMQGMAQAYPSIPTIEDQIAKYGVEFNKQLVADNEACLIDLFPYNGAYTPALYPPALRAGPSAFNRDIPAVAGLEELVVPITCELRDVTEGEVTFTPIVSSREEAYLLSSPFDLNWNQSWDMYAATSERRGPFAVIAMLQGDIKSAFDAPPPPVAPRVEEGQPPAPPEQLFDPSAHLSSSDGQGTLIAMGSTQIFQDQRMVQQAFGQASLTANGMFALNMRDMLGMGQELTKIRSVPVTRRPLKTLTAGEKQAIRWSNVMGIPLLLGVLAIVLWFVRRQRRSMVQSKYGAKEA